MPFPTKTNPKTDGPPGRLGLYDPANEHDACGVAFVASLRGTPTRTVVDSALTALLNLDHRGAVGAEEDTGDGAGILTQIPDAFFRDVYSSPLPPAGAYGIGNVFLEKDPLAAQAQQTKIAEIATREQLRVLEWRTLPTNPALIGPSALAAMPTIMQVVLVDTQVPSRTGLELERALYRVRKISQNLLDAYFASLSCRTITYKGMLTVGQLEPFYPDLSDPRYATELAIVHSRFSTNTFPSWPLAHPFRMIAHNGEINTVKGNRNWMAARQGTLRSELLGDLRDLTPICSPEASDSASLDEVLELLHLAGRPLPQAVMMMVPEAWENNPEMDSERRAFYEYHANIIEPWDGPANLTFTDGKLIGSVLDRNGLRPGRYWITSDGLVVLASEAGVLDLDPASVVRKGRVEPGKMFLVDTAAGRIIPDAEIKAAVAGQRPYGQWVAEHTIRFEDLPNREHIAHPTASVTRRQRTFGYTEEEVKRLLGPMAQTGAEPLGAMGTDTPIAVLSQQPKPLFDYFTQTFAQVTNPPLDAIREEIVTSLAGAIGPEPNMLAEIPEHARKLVLPFPILRNEELAKIINIHRGVGNTAGFKAHVVSGLYSIIEGDVALERRLEEICQEVDSARERGANFIILSDRDSNIEQAPIPSLLLTSAVHHHLLRNQTRTQVSLVVEAGDVREVHHAALLIGFGAAAINPYLAMETVEDLARRGLIDVSESQAVTNLVKALGKGVLKIMSKIGISTISSYRGAQTFEALGLAEEFVQRYFPGTSSRLGGIGIKTIARDVRARHDFAYPVGENRLPHVGLVTGGEYQWRRDGEEHLFDPETVFRLQHATRTRQYEIFQDYTRRVNEQTQRLMTLRGLLELKPAGPAISLDEVEPVSEIVKRFSTGAMSFGSISREAHETLAIAMNTLGGRSNSGEGGEEPDRLFDPLRRSRVKQIASGRFGVTSEYLVSADDIQIKLAQGAKPGEGGQLPGNKVYPWVAKTRHSTPGVGLISPPPHHDIYSIEDLAQLIHDAKNANPLARIHVKLVSELGVGTVAAGAAKAHADVVLISGHDGGTGASPLNSLKHAGTPWEMGLAETQQTLVLNDLRDRVVVQVDGQLKTGRDVVIAALLGAEEFGFATAPLVVSGCIMMRVCHLDTCPVGVATQNPELRERFTGRPEFVITFFEYIAQEVRELLAQLGMRSIAEAVGQVQLLSQRQLPEGAKAQGLDLSDLLTKIEPLPGSQLRHARAQDHGLEQALDQELIRQAGPALEQAEAVEIDLAVRNVNRTVGTMLGSQVTRKYGAAGLPDQTIKVNLVGTAGQSFGAFLPKGITLSLRGDANDYVGKGLSGGRIEIRPRIGAGVSGEANVISGNVVGYGATSGHIMLRGLAGERFAVRNSGATLVAEGVGDHALEYMTGGTVLILGKTGRNLAAGMSGGVAYVLDLDPRKLNQAAVAAGELTLAPLQDSDREQVRLLLTLHHETTDSPLAGTLLQNLEETLNRFTRILPRDYQQVQATLLEASQAGLEPTDTQVWEKILEVTHG